MLHEMTTPRAVAWIRGINIAYLKTSSIRRLYGRYHCGKQNTVTLLINLGDLPLPF